MNPDSHTATPNLTHQKTLQPKPLFGSIYQVVRRVPKLGALSFLALLSVGMPFAGAVVETDLSNAFAVGSDGYQASVPPLSLNLLAGPTGMLSFASRGPHPDETTTSRNYATLTDGSYGLVPGPGGGGQGAVSIVSNTTLNFDLGVGGYNLSNVDIFSGWGDAGRLQPSVTVRYSTVDDPFTWITLQAVNYTGAAGNAAYVNLSDLGLASAAVNRVQFVFGAQQNGYVGYTELAVRGTAAAPVGEVWSGTGGADWGTNGSWQSGAVPVAGAKINFGAAGSNGTVDLGASDRSVGALTFLTDVGTAIGTSGAGSLVLDNGAAAALVSAGGSHTITAPVKLASNATFNMVSGGQLTVAGNISETSAGKNILVGGTGKVTFAGTNSYTGITTIQDAILNVGSLADYGQVSSLGNRAADSGGGNVGILFRGGTLQYTGSTPQSTNRAIRINADGGSGFNGGATLDASGSVPSASIKFTATSSPDFFENAGNRTLTLTGSNTGDNTFAGAIIQTGGTTSVVKSGAGTWFLTNTGSSYGGITTIEGGTLNFASIGNLGQASSLGNRGGEGGGGNVGLLFRGGTLQYTGSTPQTTDRAIRINADGGGGKQGGATIDASGSVPSATLSFTAASSPDFFEFAGSRTLTLTGSNSGANTFNLAIVQTGGATSLVKSGAGTWFLTNTGSSYGGVTVFEGGTLNVASIADLGQNSSLGNRGGDSGPGNVGILFRGGTLQYTGSTPQTTNRAIRINADGGGGKAGGATIDASGSVPEATLSFTAASSPDFFENGGSRTLTLTGSNTGNNTFNMAIVETGGQTSLVKDGPGRWVIGGNNTFTGPTLITEGTLAVGISGALSGSTQIHAETGGTFDVSKPGLGSVTLSGALAMDAGSTLRFGLAKSGAHDGQQPDLTDYSQLSLASGATITDSTLSLTIGSGIQTGDIFRLIVAGTPVTGTFAGLSNFSTFNAGGQEFQINYLYNASGAFTDVNGTDVALLAVPEPASVGLLVGGIGLLAAGIRRRGRKTVA